MSHRHKAIDRGCWERVRRAALDRDGWRCRCGSPLFLEVHHVQPLDKGGDPLALDNLKTLCRSCHISLHLDPQRRAWRRLIWEAVDD